MSFGTGSVTHGAFVMLRKKDNQDVKHFLVHTVG